MFLVTSEQIDHLLGVLFRYSLSNVDAWQSAVLDVRPVDISGGRGAECSDEITVDTDIAYDVWPMGTALSRSEPACLRGGHSYEFILRIGSSGALNISDINFFVDSLVVVPSVPDQLDTLLGNASQFQTCSAYREALSTLVMEETVCEQLSFSVLSEVYNGSLCELSRLHAVRHADHMQCDMQTTCSATCRPHAVRHADHM